MYIEKHAFNSVIHGMTENDVPNFCTNILKIQFELFRPGEFNDTKTYKYSFGKAKVSVYIRVNTSNKIGYVTLDLKGSFFDNSPDFRFDDLLEFLSNFEYTPKQLDIAYNDDQKTLSTKEIVRWCRDCDYYCKGSLVEREAPEEVRRKWKFRRIQLGFARSKTNYATIYRRRVKILGRFKRLIRIEVKLKDKDKIAYLLENYCDENPIQFETRSLELLNSCINFVTLTNKKRRKRQQQPSWRKFLESDIKEVNWSKLRAERLKNRIESDKTTLEKSVKRQATMLRNVVARGAILSSKQQVIKQLEELSGFRLEELQVET